MLTSNGDPSLTSSEINPITNGCLPVAIMRNLQLPSLLQCYAEPVLLVSCHRIVSALVSCSWKTCLSFQGHIQS